MNHFDQYVTGVWRSAFQMPPKSLGVYVVRTGLKEQAARYTKSERGDHYWRSITAPREVLHVRQWLQTERDLQNVY